VQRPNKQKRYLIGFEETSGSSKRQNE